MYNIHTCRVKVMPNRSRIGCLDDLGNSISIVIVTYYLHPFTQDNHLSHSKYSLAIYINKYNYYLSMLFPPLCIYIQAFIHHFLLLFIPTFSKTFSK